MQLLRPTEAARELGISYPTLKQWIYRGSLKSIRTAGGHHRITRAEIDRLLGGEPAARSATAGHARQPGISGRNKLYGRVTGVRYEGLLAEVRLDVGGQPVTAIITRNAAEELELSPGVEAAALVKATEVMVIRD